MIARRGECRRPSRRDVGGFIRPPRSAPPPGRRPAGRPGVPMTRRAQRFVRGAHATAGDEEVPDVAGLKATGGMSWRPGPRPLGGGAEAALPELDGPARPGHAVVKRAAAQHVVAGELIAPDHAAALADADLRGGVRDERPGERRQGLQKLRDGERPLAAFLLGHRQEIAARGQLLGDSAQGELADDLAGLRRGAQREVRAPFGKRPSCSAAPAARGTAGPIRAPRCRR